MAISLHKFFLMADIVHDHNLAVPKNIRLTEKDNSLLIEYSWFKLKYFLLLFLFPFCAYVVVQSPYIDGTLHNPTLPVWVIAGVNIGVIYYSLTRLLNSTAISVNHNRIEITHGPLPLGRNMRIDRAQLTQLFVTKKRMAHRYYLYSSTYQVNAILKDDQIITLVKGLYEPEQGRFIEKKIEKFLGITDISVEGELEKD